MRAPQEALSMAEHISLIGMETVFVRMNFTDGAVRAAACAHQTRQSRAQRKKAQDK